MIIVEKKRDIQLFHPLDDAQGKSIKQDKVLEDFFTDFTLEHAQDDLWSLIKAAMGDRTGSEEEVEHYFFVYERLSDLLSAVYLVARKKHLKKKQKHGKPTSKRDPADR